MILLEIINFPTIFQVLSEAYFLTFLFSNEAYKDFVFIKIS